MGWGLFVKVVDAPESIDLLLNPDVYLEAVIEIMVVGDCRLKIVVV